MEEIYRQKKVIDMMITAHSVLRDRYNRWAGFFEVILLVASVILNALIFVDTNFIKKFTDLNEDWQKLIIGLSCLSVFVISMIMLQVSWRAIATKRTAPWRKYPRRVKERAYLCLQSYFTYHKKRLIAIISSKKFNIPPLPTTKATLRRQGRFFTADTIYTHIRLTQSKSSICI